MRVRTETLPPIAIVFRDADMQGFGSSDDLLRVVPGPGRDFATGIERKQTNA